jgi:hypothetical protein
MLHRSQVLARQCAALIVFAAAGFTVAGCVVPGTSRSAVEHTAVTGPPSMDVEETPGVSQVPGPGEPREPSVAPSPQLATPIPSDPAGKRFSWAGSDGQRTSGNAELLAKARADLIDCRADAPSRAEPGAGGEACMKEKAITCEPLTNTPES